MASKLAMEVLVSLPCYGKAWCPLELLARVTGQTTYRAIRTAFMELKDEFGIEVVATRENVKYTVNDDGWLRDVQAGSFVAAISLETWEKAQCVGQKYWDEHYSA